MSSPPMDPYKVLGIAMDAQLPDIRTAHRKLILKCHPDKVSDPALKAQKQDEFQKVQQAYEILSDEEQRVRCDDMLKLYALRERMSQKPNTSAPRASPAKQYPDFEIRTAEPPRSKSYRGERETTPRDAPPNVKIYSYGRSPRKDDPREDDPRGPRYYEDVRPSRRGESYPEKPSKRESERESQRDREKREDKERRKEKDRRKLEKEREREEEARRQAERAAKKEAKRVREKQEARDRKREKDDKRRERETTAYIEPSDDEILHKKSSSRKYDARERSSGRDEPPLRRTYTDGPQMRSAKISQARAYIHRSQTSGPPNRSTAYHSQDPQPPAAPTPPPAPSGAYVAPEEDEVRRSSARARRGSSDIPPSMPRERNMHRSSRDPVQEDPLIVDATPAATRTRYTTAPLSESPPRGPVRTNTMPAEKPSRHTPPRRSHTYSEGPEIAGNRGRDRSKMHPQADISEDEVEFEELPPRRSEPRSRKERSPRGQKIRYHVADGRTKLHSSSSYSRPIPQKQAIYQYDDVYDYEPARSAHASRPEYGRNTSSYSGGVSYAKFKQAPAYDHRDVAYSHFDAPTSAHYDDRVYA